MSSYYGVIFPEFWTGPTGRELRQRGGKDAQLMGLYLATNRHANMLGLYHLLIDDVRHETGLSFKAIERGLEATAQATFAIFDAASDFVWVRQMARFRLGLKSTDALDPNDKRVTAINRIYHALEVNPFLGSFFDANRRALCLKKKREPESTLVVPFSTRHQMSPFQAPSKPLGSQITDLQITEVQGSEIREQESGTRDQKKARLAPPTPDEPKQNRNVIRALVVEVVNEADPDTGFPDLKELAKEACARHRIAYDADVVGSALEQALARRNGS